MENATKALLIAGSIFLAIALITFGIYIYQGLHDMANAQDEKNAQDQLAAFNKKYEAYNKSVMYGIDVITVINMSYEDNIKYNTNIQIFIDGVKKEKQDVILQGKIIDDEMKSDIYKCLSVEYDSLGRINVMRFELIKKTD